MLIDTLVLKVSGPDSIKFLQGQLTCDVAVLEDGHNTFGAYCTIQGKVQSLFRVYKDEDAFLFQTHPELLEQLHKELQRYAVFSKVQLEIVSIPLPKVDELAEILAKIPALYPQTVGVFFPHDINLPNLEAVSFTKGCYRGQEIVARMQHRGNLKRHLYSFNTELLNINPGDKINVLGTDNSVGTIVRSVVCDGKSLGLAVITSQFAAEQLQVNNCPLQIMT